MRHYFTFGGKAHRRHLPNSTSWELSTTTKKPKASRNTSSGADPYVTLSHSKLLHNEEMGFNLEGYARYYIPVSRDTQDGLNSGFIAKDGGPNDVSNGQLRLYVNPTKTFLDGKLTLSGATMMNFKFSRLSAQERFDRQTAEIAKHGDDSVEAKSFREDAYLFFDPTATYSVSSKVDMYLEYATATSAILRMGSGPPSAIPTMANTSLPVSSGILIRS